MVSRQGGFSYLTVLFALAILASGLALAGEVWETSAKREKEAELLHAGNEYRKAIERYYLSGPKRYPRELADLVRDPRQAGTVRHLRRLYPDPITGKNEWGLVKAGDGGIAGVYSLSEGAPLKIAGFAVRDASLEGKSRYADWQFVYVPGAPSASVPSSPPAVAASPGK